MPASFKVRSVPLDGSNEAFEEVLDPDFGESAIGRVAPVDSGELVMMLLVVFHNITKIEFLEKMIAGRYNSYLPHFQDYGGLYCSEHMER